MNDIPSFQHELFAAFVPAGVAAATLVDIDASEALVGLILSLFFPVCIFLLSVANFVAGCTGTKSADEPGRILIKRPI